MAEDKITINLLIGKIRQQLSVPRADEAVYRKAADTINERLARYEEQFPNLGTERYLSSVLLELAIHAYKLSEQKSVQPLFAALSTLTQEVEEALDKKAR